MFVPLLKKMLFYPICSLELKSKQCKRVFDSIMSAKCTKQRALLTNPLAKGIHPEFENI